MQLLFILTLIFAILVATFALQNAYPVTIYFLKWKFEASFGLVILISLLIGAVAVGSLGLVHQAKTRMKKRTLGGDEDEKKTADGIPENQVGTDPVDLDVQLNEAGGVDDSPQEVEG